MVAMLLTLVLLGGALGALVLIVGLSLDVLGGSYELAQLGGRRGVDRWASPPGSALRRAWYSTRHTR